MIGESKLRDQTRQAGYGKLEHAVPVASAALALLAYLFGLFTDTPQADWQPKVVTLVCMALAAATFSIGQWNDQWGRWAVVIGFSISLITAASLLDAPGALSLWGGVAGLAAVTISMWAGLGMAMCGSIILATLAVYGWAGPVPRGLLASSLTSIWAMTGIAYWVYVSAEGMGIWSWHHFERAQRLLEEVRGRQAELHQALDDLAHANRQLALTNENLATMRRLAEDSQRAKAIFVSKVSHEFRTPLNMIIGLTDLVIDNPSVYESPIPLGLLQDLQIVHRNCEHLATLVNDVLDLSQVEAGRMALYREEVDLGNLLRDSVEVVRPLLEKKGLGLELALEPALHLRCDPTRIRQVVLNLVSNAARFTERGWVRIRTERDAGMVVVSVADTGAGIPKDDAERIFEPFYQAGTRPNRAQSGSGLGLSISRQFVMQHGGRMWLESKVGEGSTFSFSLPMGDEARPRAGAERWISEQWPWVERRVRSSVPLADLTPRLVLFDEAGDLERVLVRYARDVEFVAAESVEEAVAELKSGDSLGAIVNTASSNTLWPTVDSIGRQVPHVPVLGCAFPPSKEHAESVGAVDYLVKPIDRQALARVLGGIGLPVERVLVVDDDPDSRLLFERMLHAWRPSLEVVAVASGSEALARLREDPPWDAVLLDVIMPQMDGWQVLDSMQHSGLGHVPVVMVSAQDAREEPLASPLVMVSSGHGLSLATVLRYLVELLSLMHSPINGGGSGVTPR